jgi:AraC family transcriptional regulator of adaptative response / DNA-3-methyladenine glycosylase II
MTYTWTMTTYSAVVTTGIYCRPGCGAKPLARNVRTFELPAAAEAAGFRACHRCRPYRVAGPVGSGAPELVCQVVQMIIDGALDDGTEAELAGRVGMSPRHLRRLFLKHLGASPDQLARSRRAHFARRLLDDTDLTVIDIAFASGFGSLRQFNRTMQEVFRASPTDLRSRRRRADRLAADGGLALRLPVLPGYDWDAVRTFLEVRALPGVEVIEGDTYRRTISVGGAPGLLEISPGGEGYLLLRAHLPHWEGLIHVVGRVGRLLGLDTDHAAGAAALRADTVLGAIVRDRPGLAVSGAWSAFEIGVWAILSRGRDPGSVAQWLEAVVTSLGMPVPGLPAGLTHTFPDAEVVTSASLATIGLPTADATAVAALATAIADGNNAAGCGTSVDVLAALPVVDPGSARLPRLPARTARGVPARRCIARCGARGSRPAPFEHQPAPGTDAGAVAAVASAFRGPPDGPWRHPRPPGGTRMTGTKQHPSILPGMTQSTVSERSRAESARRTSYGRRAGGNSVRGPGDRGAEVDPGHAGGREVGDGRGAGPDHHGYRQWPGRQLGDRVQVDQTGHEQAVRTCAA